MNQWNKDVLREIDEISFCDTKLGAEEQARILNLTCKKIGQKIKRHNRKPVRVALIAAAILCACTVTVVAGVSFQMGNGTIGFFDGDSDSMLQSLRPDLESYTAQINQAITHQGVTVTLDSISADRNIINAFFTATSDQPYEVWSKNPHETNDEIARSMSEEFIVGQAGPHFSYKITGEGMSEAVLGAETVESYKQDDNTVKIMVRIVPDQLLPDKFTIDLNSSETFYTQGNWSFSNELDISTVSPGKIADKQILQFNTAEGEKKLELEKLALTPFGIGVSATNRAVVTTDKDEDYKYTDGYTNLEQMLIRDDKGNVLNRREDGNGGDTNYDSYELLGVSPDTKSISFTPIVYPEYKTDEERIAAFKEVDKRGRMIMNVTDIGSKVETSNLGGYTLTNYSVEGSDINFTLKPYGYTTNVELSPVDDHVTLTSNKRIGMQSVKQDYKTGELMFSIHYYAATPEELAQITQFEYSKDLVTTLDEAATVTVELK